MLWSEKTTQIEHIYINHISSTILAQHNIFTFTWINSEVHNHYRWQEIIEYSESSSNNSIYRSLLLVFELWYTVRCDSFTILFHLSQIGSRHNLDNIPLPLPPSEPNTLVKLAENVKKIRKTISKDFSKSIRRISRKIGQTDSAIQGEFLIMVKERVKK